MKRTHWLTLSAAFAAAAAAAYGVHLITKPEVAATPSPLPHSAACARPRPVARHSSQTSETSLSRAHSPQPQSDTATEPHPVPGRCVSGSPINSQGQVLSESQWRERAQQVEITANHELRKLSSLLDLDPVQQDQIFSALVRQSPNWLPGMTSGTTTSSANSPSSLPASSSSNTSSTSTAADSTDLTAYLNPEQQEELINEELNRQAWWAEVLPQLLPPALADASPASVSTPAASETAAPAAIKDFDGSATLLEE